MTEAKVAEAVRSLASDGRPVEVMGTGSLLQRLPTPGDAERLRLGDLRGIVRHDAADLTVTVRAGTSVADLNTELAEVGQECPISGPGTSVGGRVASGLSGVYRLGLGHVREWVLGARVVTAQGRVVRIGGATMKNVTGYDLPRLFCGSWGTLGVMTELTLRIRPIPAERGWWVTEDLALEPGRLYRPTAVIRTKERIHVGLEGHPVDCEQTASRLGLERGGPPEIQSAIRVSVPPGLLPKWLARAGEGYAAELGVGNLHLEPWSGNDLGGIRAEAEAVGGRMLLLDREVRDASGLSVFGHDASSPLTCRIKEALDPSGLFAPWRFAA